MFSMPRLRQLRRRGPNWGPVHSQPSSNKSGSHRGEPKVWSGLEEYWHCWGDTDVDDGSNGGGNEENPSAQGPQCTQGRVDWCLGGKGRIGGNVIPQSLWSFGIVTVEGLLVWWEGSYIREWTQGGRGGFRAKYALEDKVFMIPVPDLMTLVLEKNNTSCLFY